MFQGLIKAAALAFLLAAGGWGAALADEPLPLVEESVDEIWHVTFLSEDLRTVSCARLLFRRDGKFFADRIAYDDMLWLAVDDRLELHWADYSQCDRIIRTRRLVLMSMPYADLPDVASLEWWNCAVCMTDLKAAP